MKLSAPEDLLEALRRRGLLSRRGWPQASPDGDTGADLLVEVEGAHCACADLIPLPSSLGGLGDTVSRWACSGGRRGTLTISTPHQPGAEVLGPGELERPEGVISALRRLCGDESGEWSALEVGDAEPSGVLEWRRHGWSIRFDAGRAAGIEVVVPLASRPSGRGGPSRADCELVEQVERLEKAGGSVLVHLRYPGSDAGADRPEGMLESPIRLPRVLEVHTLRAGGPADAPPPPATTERRRRLAA